MIRNLARLRAFGRNWASAAYFAALVVLVAVPLAVAAGVLVTRQMQDVTLTERKSSGLEFESRLQDATRELHTLRAGLWLHGTVALADRLAVERALTRLYDYNTGQGKGFNLAKPLERLDTAWRATPERGGAMPQIGLALQRVAELRGTVEQRSSLRTETDDVTTDLVDAYDTRLATLENRVDQARNLFLAAGLAPKHTGSVAVGVAILSDQARQAYSAALADLNHAAATKDGLAPARDAVVRVGPALASFERVATAPAGNYPPQLVAQRAELLSRSLDRASRLVYGKAYDAFERRLADQQNVLLWLKWGTFGAGLVALMLGIVLVRTLEETNRREIRRVREEAERLKTLRENDRMRELLALTEARFEAVFDRASIGVAILDRDGNIVRTNATLEEMLPNADSAEFGVAGSDYARLVSGELDAFSVDIQRLSSDARRAYEAVVSLVSDDFGAPLFAVALVKDVTERRESDQRLMYEATHDELVQLPNRNYLVERMKNLVGENRPEGFAGVTFVDMDDFKSINDTLGHEVGDRVLIAAARRLRSAIDAGDFVARFGGDEFVVLLAPRPEREDTIAATDRIVRTLSAPYQIDGREVFVTISAGLAIVDRPYRAVQDLLRDADTAMYHAKEAGRSRFAIFDPSMRDRAMRRRSLANQLRRALEREQFYLVFQPVVSLKTEDVQSLEVLLRWEHPELGLVPPAEFVRVLEEIGLIVPVGRWVLERACSQLARWREESSAFDGTYLSVNASVREVMQTDYCDFVERTLARHGLRAGDLVLEVTETVLLQSDRYADRTLERLKRAGVGLAIDDFGTGYSSLRYLHQFPFDHLKIDASFVRGADGGLASEPIVAMLIALGKAFRVNVIAEGVETREQASRLRMLGCASAQGYFFGAAVAPSGVPPMMDRRRFRSVAL